MHSVAKYRDVCHIFLLPFSFGGRRRRCRHPRHRHRVRVSDASMLRSHGAANGFERSDDVVDIVVMKSIKMLNVVRSIIYNDV